MRPSVAATCQRSTRCSASFDHDVDVVTGDAASGEDRGQEATLPMPTLVFAGEHVFAQCLAQLSITGPILAEAVQLTEDLRCQLWRGNAVDRDTPPWRPGLDPGKPADLARRTRNRAEIVATHLPHRSENGGTLEPRYLFSAGSDSHDLSG